MVKITIKYYKSHITVNINFKNKKYQIKIKIKKIKDIYTQSMFRKKTQQSLLKSKNYEKDVS